MLLDPPNLTGWVNIPLRRMLADRLGLPVTVEHDAKAAALGEYHYGAGRGERDMVYIVVGTGVGSALILDGELHRGRNNSAGEVGHITIRTEGDRCSCGNMGCVESLAAGPAIARAYRRALAATGEPEWAESIESITAENVVERARGGESLAAQVLADAGAALGTAVATLAMILDVELYVIGSGVAKAGNLLLQPARDAVSHHAHRSVAARVRIVRSELEDDGPILGCGWLARQRM
jgi:glucokinase